MKNRLSIVVMVSLVVIAGLVWLTARSQRAELKTDAASVPMALVETLKPQVLAQAAPVDFPAAQTPAPVVDHIDADGVQKHVAQSGETVSSLATNLLGKDNKTNRDAIINANASLKTDPDKLLAGKSYSIPSPAEVATPAAVTESPTIQPDAQPVALQPAKELKYTARPGDTVANMAGAFLGNTDESHQDAIINANKSLRSDPDHVIAGKTYKIPTPDGLSAAAVTPAVTASTPTTQPDADQVVVAGSPRTLRYVAQAGDTVTTLAVQLLGSDTPEARDAIISNNPSLKRNPDRVIAGQAYWIPAPTASIQGQ